MTHPLSDIEDEIRWLYLTKGKLKKVIDHGLELITHSKTRQTASSSEATQPVDNGLAQRAIERLTLGGILPLERTLTQLHSFLLS